MQAEGYKKIRNNLLAEFKKRGGSPNTLKIWAEEADRAT